MAGSKSFIHYLSLTMAGTLQRTHLRWPATRPVPSAPRRQQPARASPPGGRQQSLRLATKPVPWLRSRSTAALLWHSCATFSNAYSPWHVQARRCSAELTLVRGKSSRDCTSDTYVMKIVPHVMPLQRACSCLKGIHTHLCGLQSANLFLIKESRPSPPHLHDLCAQLPIYP